MVEPLLAASFTLGGAAIGAGIIARLTTRRPDNDTYIDPHPQPPDWVNDAHHHRRPRRGTWRQDCTNG